MTRPADRQDAVEQLTGERFARSPWFVWQAPPPREDDLAAIVEHRRALEAVLADDLPVPVDDGLSTAGKEAG